MTNKATYVVTAMAKFFTGTAGCTPCEEARSLDVTLETSATDVMLRDVVALPDGRAIAVGDGGTIITRDASGTWTARNSRVSSPLAGVTALRTGGTVRALAVGEAGVVLASDDAGVRWTAITSGTTVDLTEVTLGGLAGTAAVALGGGVILYSDDRGDTWSVAELPAKAVDLRAVASLDDRFLAVGTAGSALVSHDAGASWTAIDVGVTTDLYGVGWISGRDDEADFLIVGAGGTARRMLDDDGRDWEALDFMTQADLMDLGGDRWSLASDGTIRLGGGLTGPLSADAGGPAPLRAIDGDQGDAWIVGGSGTVLHATVSGEHCSYIY